MKRLLIYIQLSLAGLFGNSQSISGWLTKLDSSIGQSGSYTEMKMHRINTLRQSEKNDSKPELYNQYLSLFNEFSTFNADSAYSYAKKMDSTAVLLKDSSRINYSKLKLCFILLSSGMFKEVFEVAQLVNLRYLNQREKAEYYSLMARCYYDLTDYDHQLEYSSGYSSDAEKYLDSAINLLPGSSFESVYYYGLKSIKRGEIDSATMYFRELTTRTDLSLHQQALLGSTFADVFIRNGKNDSALIMLARAAISDIKSSTKETTALQNLATLLFKQGNPERASTYIHKAINDADFYGARQRILQVSSILPMIEGQMIKAVKEEKQKIYAYAMVVTFLVISLVVLASITIRQNRKLAIQRDEISNKTFLQQDLLTEKDKLLEEKEFLLKEIHHRVKNNLQLIISLLNSQSAFLTNNEAILAIRDSQRRIQAVSLIHQKLYQSGSIDSVDLKPYITELITDLEETFNVNHNVRLEFQIDSVKLDLSQSIPIGLILNEAVTNSIKYAFPPGEKGQISISIISNPENKIMLRLRDNGKGLPGNFDINAINSFGMSLMQGLARQLEGSFTINSVEGVDISVIFPVKKYDAKNIASTLINNYSAIQL
ncbi:MAG: hypothetical protein EKK37_11955 [Sphingobacteriales bacterium]|nr:MAG: hypothetical protein EKK37_11955 [Sphingobacteriales bacterium]